MSLCITSGASPLMSGGFLPILAAGANEWLIYSLGAVVVVYLVIRPLMRKKADPLEPVPRLSLSQQRGIERDMQNLLVELSEMARQVTGQLDTRAAKLDALLQEADEKIAELRRLTDRVSTMDNPPEQPADLEPMLVAPSPPPNESRHRDVYALADAGRSVHEIAQELQRPRGEVELILALRPR